jgi:branched-chain amino acid transport system substrate-binding protein
MRKTARTLVIAASLTLLAAAVQAQIRIGQTSGFTGPVAAGVKEINEGAKLYLDSVNAEGGIAGQKVELVSLDDKFDVKTAVENAKKLIADPKVIALFLNRGTPHAEALVPVLAEGHIVLLAPSTGAMSMHQPVQPYVFNVRATYQREAEHVARHLGMGGIERVALVQVNDSFGADAMSGALKVFKEANKTPSVHVLMDREKPDVAGITAKIIAAKPLGVLFVGSSAGVAACIRSMRAAGSLATMATLSNNASTGFVKALGPDAKDVIVSQVFPSERKLAAPMIAEAVRLATAKGITDITPAMLEGFAATKVLVLGLKRASAGKDGVTRAGFKKALESFQRVDIGGLEISYSATDHTGLDYSDLSYIGADGKFKR